MLLAIDPGTRNIGYCVGYTNALEVITSGTVVTTGSNFPDQLYQIKNKLESLIVNYNIHTLVYEKPTYTVGHANGTKVQQAIGVMLYLTSAYNITNITEYTPSEIKRLLTASGKADKKDIQAAILKHLPNVTFDAHHESDAIGMYICWYIAYANTVLKSQRV